MILINIYFSILFLCNVKEPPANTFVVQPLWINNDTIPEIEKVKSTQIKFDSVRLTSIITTELGFKNNRGNKAVNFEFTFLKSDYSIIKVNYKAWEAYVVDGKVLPFLGGNFAMFKGEYYSFSLWRENRINIFNCDYYALNADNFDWVDTLSLQTKKSSNCNEVEFFRDHVDLDNKVYGMIGPYCLNPNIENPSSFWN